MSRLLSVLVVLLVVVTSRQGYADIYEPEAPDPASIEFEEVLRTAKALARNRLPKRALYYFRAAYSIRVTYKSAGNLGMMELELGQYLNAYRHLVEALSVLPQEQKDIAKLLNDELEAAKAHLFTLSIDVHPGAEVFLDGEKIGQAPIKPVMVDPGSHTVSAQLLGFKSGLVTVVGKAGQRQGVSLTIEAPHGQEQAGDELSLPAMVAVTGGSVTFVSLATSIGLTVWANAVASEAEDADAAMGDSECYRPTDARVAQCAELMSLLDEQSTAHDAAVGMWITTGALTLASGGSVAAALLLADGNKGDAEKAAGAEETLSVTVIPSIGVDHGGVALVGTW